MDPNSINLITALATIGSFIVTAIGLLGVYVQIKKLRESAWSNTHSKLCDQSFELLKFLAEKPETYDYFYNEKALGDGHKDRVYILYAAEAIANFLEHLILQKENLPDQQWAVWHRFIYSTYKSSAVLRDFLHSHRDWYSVELLYVTDELDKELKTYPELPKVS